MANQSKIEWTDKTWNPVTGCTKVSQGCKHCYAERLFPRPYPGRDFTDVQCHPERLQQPLSWRKPLLVFVNSMSDLFHEQVSFEFIARIWSIMDIAKQHVFQILTKRPARVLEFYEWWNSSWKAVNQFGFILPNVWLGVSVENQEAADERIPLLLQTPAAVRFLSVEPLLGMIDLEQYLYVPTVCEECGHDRAYYDTNPHSLPTIVSPVTGKHECLMGCQVTGEPGASRCARCHSLKVKELNPIHWTIVGGESGPSARSCKPEWMRSIVSQCKEASVPCFVKQLSQADTKDFRNFESFPEDLQIREFPNT